MKGLGANKIFNMEGFGARKIVVISQQGSSGKTTISALLHRYLKEKGNSVIINKGIEHDKNVDYRITDFSSDYDINESSIRALVKADLVILPIDVSAWSLENELELISKLKSDLLIDPIILLNRVQSEKAGREIRKDLKGKKIRVFDGYLSDNKIYEKFLLNQSINFDEKEIKEEVKDLFGEIYMSACGAVATVRIPELDKTVVPKKESNRLFASSDIKEYERIVERMYLEIGKKTILRIDGVNYFDESYAVNYSFQEYVLRVSETTKDREKAVPFILELGHVDKIPKRCKLMQE